jgi:hypothetical protein
MDWQSHGRRKLRRFWTGSPVPVTFRAEIGSTAMKSVENATISPVLSQIALQLGLTVHVLGAARIVGRFYELEPALSADPTRP